MLQRVLAAVRSRLGLPPPLVRDNILGRPVLVREGSLRKTPDYDDAWRLACACRSEVIFDIGANVGQAAFTELLSENLKLLVLVEANAEALSIAAENLIRNHLSQRVRFVPAFASDSNHASVRFWTVGTGSAGSMYGGHARTAAHAGKTTDVPTVTVDHLCDFYSTIPDLIKVDSKGLSIRCFWAASVVLPNRRQGFSSKCTPARSFRWKPMRAWCCNGAVRSDVPRGT